MEEALRARLLAWAGLAALVDRRIWPVTMPQGETLPAVTFQVISPGRIYTHDGGSALAGPRVQFDAWGSTSEQAKLVARQIVPALEPEATVAGIRFVRAFLSAERDMQVTDLPAGGRVFRTSLDFFLWWQPVS